VALHAALDNQAARRLSDRLLAAERTKGAHMNSSLAGKDTLLHDLQARVRAVVAGASVARSLAHACAGAPVPHARRPDGSSNRQGNVCTRTRARARVGRRGHHHHPRRRRHQVAEQASQLERLRADAALMDASLQDSQRTALGLNSRLSLAEARCDELLGQTQVRVSTSPVRLTAAGAGVSLHVSRLGRHRHIMLRSSPGHVHPHPAFAPPQAQSEQLADAATRASKQASRLEATRAQLDAAKHTTKELRDAAAVSWLAAPRPVSGPARTHACV
jgi:hypothetical protein